jgi:hypothetical protein
MNRLKAFVFMLGLAATLAAPGSALAAAPANDDFAAAEELTGYSDVARTTNEEATKEPNEPNHGGPSGASIWYRWTAPADGNVVVSTCESDFDTLVGVYTGTAVGSLTQIAANDNGCGMGRLQSRLSFQATIGTTYSLAIDGFGGDSGLVDLTVDVPPANDNFSAALPISGEVGSVDGTTLGATNQPGEPVFGRRSVWFSWTAPSSGRATFGTCGSDFDTMLAAYSGAAVDELTGIAGSDDHEDCDFASRIDFVASAGIVYRIAVSGYDREEMGNYVLSWTLGGPAPMQVPVVNGIARDGEALTATDGTWSGTGPFTYSYAWGRCDRFDDCDYIPGANAQTFTIRSVDVGYHLWVRVTASNAVGSAEAFSAETSVVVARAPWSVLPPDVDGEARLGAILVAGPGSWLGTAPISYTYQWQACDAAVATCSNIDGQTGQVMRVNSLDLGAVLRVVVTATNAAGSAAAASVGTDVVRATPPMPRCVVPNVRGKSVAQARRMLRAKRCALGRVTRAYSASLRKGKIIRQSRRPAARLPRGTRVNVVVSRGRRR